MFTKASGSSNPTERMRIDSSGVVSITNSNNGINAYVENDTHNAVFQIKASATNKNSILWFGDSTNDQIGQIDYDHANNSMRFLTAAGERMRITSGGAVYMYDIIGFSGTNSDMRYDSGTGQVYYLTSSLRYKSDISDLENSLDKINNLRPVRFKDNYTQEYTTGLIAEEVVETIPEVVFKKQIEGFDEPQVEGVNYSDLVPFLIKSIQELKAEIELLKTQINN